ncbi:MAG: hypothetical protein ACI85Q_001351 [Salibacteraceae bacterium]|jgi:hypothetical protein
MKYHVTQGLFSIFLFFLSIFFITACSKTELHSFTGTVLDNEQRPVINAIVKVFETPQDWLTGHNVVTTMSTNLVGKFESSTTYESGDYFIFIEKLDTTNWNIRDVEKGIYPQISLPQDNEYRETIEHNNMGLLANTNWELTNILTEYTRPNTGTKQWLSIWSTTNNCEKDNMLHYGKDLTLRINEGNAICSGNERNILGSFIPPLIFTTYSCDQLIHTSQEVKQFEFSGWPKMNNRNGEMFLACDQSIGQLYVTYNKSAESKRLLVYSRK